VGPCNYQIIKKIKETLNIPVVLNGGISDFKDAEYALNYTKCDGVMSSESILEYPALFEPSKIYDLDDLCIEYLDFYEKYPGEATFNIARAHVHKFLHSGFNLHGHGDLRERLNNVLAKPENLIEMKKIAMEMKERRININPIDKITWYYRHWKG
jgi:tRNA-dihydrouridine synthase 1